MVQAHRKLGLPTGTETLQLREAARHRRISTVLERVFSLWGYNPAETPLIDYFEVYRRLIPEHAIKRTYRAVDRQGEILALRSDTTLFLAKQLGLHLREEELPVRVYYNDQIVRAEDENNPSNNEFQQAGIELVGVAGPEGEAEAITIAWDAISALEVPAPVMHIGSHRIVHAAAAVAGIDQTDRDAMDSFVESVRTRRAPADAPILRFIGSPPEFRTAIAAVSEASIREAAEPFTALLNLLEQVLSADSFAAIRVDLSELGSQSYYSDAAFGVYLPTTNAAILRGGRYDSLLASFGFDAPSVGFSIFTRKLPPDTMRAESDPAAPASGADFAGRVKHAREGHRAGRRVSL